MDHDDAVPKANERPRPLAVLAVGIAAVVAVLGLWALARWILDPYRPGSTVDAVAECQDLREIGRGIACSIRIGPTEQAEWIGQATDAPVEWAGHRIEGSLHIIENWGRPSAEFSSSDVTLSVWGGRPDGRHFFAV